MDNNLIMEQLKQYGKVGIATHLTVSFSILGCLMLGMRRVKQTDKIIKYFKLENKVPKNAGSYVVALVVYKAIMPIRFAISLMILPFVIRAVGAPDPEPQPTEPTA